MFRGSYEAFHKRNSYTEIQQVRLIQTPEKLCKSIFQKLNTFTVFLILLIHIYISERLFVISNSLKSF